MKRFVFTAAGICLLAAALICITAGCRASTAPDAGLSEAGRSMKDAAQTMKDKVKDEITSAAEKVSEGASELGEKISEKISDANEALEEGVTRLKDAVDDDGRTTERESGTTRP